MLTSESVNMQARPNLVYVEGGTSALRLAPEQARGLGLREGQVINALVANRPDGSVLLLGAKSLALPPGFAAGQTAVSLLVSLVGGQIVLSLTDRQPSAQIKPRAQGAPQQRFNRLLGQIGSFHLSRQLNPDSLSRLIEQFADSKEGQSLRELLLSGRSLLPDQVKRSMENSGLFLENQLKSGQMIEGVGLKSVLLAIQRLMKARQMDASGIWGAIDELEARQLDSLSSVLGGRSFNLSWVLPFIDQMPVFLSLGKKADDEADEKGEQKDGERSIWYVDLEIPVKDEVRCGANLEFDKENQVKVTAWIPHQELFSLAVKHKEKLTDLLQQSGLSVLGTQFYPTQRAQREPSIPPGFKGLEVSA